MSDGDIDQTNSPPSPCEFAGQINSRRDHIRDALCEAITRTGAMTPGLYVLFGDDIGHTIDNRAASDQ